MKIINNKTGSTPYCDKGLEVCNCHSEARQSRKNPADLDVSAGSLCRLSSAHDDGFTLAEVLIALVVIGVIAAITMTTVMPNIQERVNSQRQANIVYKITQATNLMKANGAMVDGFASTDAFVDELQKYLKIMKRCDSDHIADCWPTKKVIDSEGNEYDISKAKTRADLGFTNDANKSIKNVGIVLNDGASIIMTYNPANGGIGIGDQLIAQSIPLPVGGKDEEFLEYTTNSTAGLAFIMDVNGGKGPNKDIVTNENNKKYYDIRNLNGASFSKFKYALITTPTPFNCVANPTNKFCAQLNENGRSYTAATNDYWAGAMNDCDALGGHIPTRAELQSILGTQKEKYGLTNLAKEYFWTSELCYYPDIANTVRFQTSLGSRPRNSSEPQAFCIGD